MENSYQKQSADLIYWGQLCIYALIYRYMYTGKALQVIHACGSMLLPFIFKIKIVFQDSEPLFNPEET